MTSTTEAPQPPRQGRPRRWGLYGPILALAMALAASGGAWLWMKSEVERGLDAATARMKAAGGTLAWSQRRIYGWPFRIDVDFDNLSWRGPDGWGFSVPALRSESSLFAPGHWVAFAPAGATILRPRGGNVRVASEALRASVSALNDHPPSLSLEGESLTFTPAPGAAPYVLSSAAELHLHTRAGPSDQGAVLIEVDGARTAPGSRLSALAGGGKVDFTADAIFDRADAFNGLDWSSAARGWTAAGGKAQVRRLHFQAGTFTLDAHGNGLTLDAEGRLDGRLDATLTNGAAALDALAAADAMKPEVARTAALVLGAAGARKKGSTVLDFQAGRTTLGPAALGPAPKVY